MNNPMNYEPSSQDENVSYKPVVADLLQVAKNQVKLITDELNELESRIQNWDELKRKTYTKLESSAVTLSTVFMTMRRLENL